MRAPAARCAIRDRDSGGPSTGRCRRRRRVRRRECAPRAPPGRTCWRFFFRREVRPTARQGRAGAPGVSRAPAGALPSSPARPATRRSLRGSARSHRTESAPADHWESAAPAPDGRATRHRPFQRPPPGHSSRVHVARRLRGEVRAAHHAAGGGTVSGQGAGSSLGTPRARAVDRDIARRAGTCPAPHPPQGRDLAALHRHTRPPDARSDGQFPRTPGGVRAWPHPRPAPVRSTCPGLDSFLPSPRENGRREYEMQELARHPRRPMLDEDVRAHASDHHDDDSRRAIGRGTRPEEHQRCPDLQRADQKPEPDGKAPEGKCPRPPARRVELVPPGAYRTP